MSETKGKVRVDEMVKVAIAKGVPAIVAKALVKYRRKDVLKVGLEETQADVLYQVWEAANRYDPDTMVPWLEYSMWFALTAMKTQYAKERRRKRKLEQKKMTPDMDEENLSLQYEQQRDLRAVIDEAIEVADLTDEERRVARGRLAGHTSRDTPDVEAGEFSQRTAVRLWQRAQRKIAEVLV